MMIREAYLYLCFKSCDTKMLFAVPWMTYAPKEGMRQDTNVVVAAMQGNALPLLAHGGWHGPLH